MFMRWQAGSVWAAIFLIVAASAPAAAQAPRSGPAAARSSAVESDGTVVVPSFRLPPSVYNSPAAKAAIDRNPQDWGAQFKALTNSGNVASMRKATRESSAKANNELARSFDVLIEDAVVAGVSGVWVRVAAHPTKRVLINLPGGAFVLGTAHGSGMKESIPLAKALNADILLITYRQAPEATFPAASEDVEKVYREMLKTYRPRDVGVFGSSAGGLLTAQALAWFDHQKLPMPGAVGILCASADARWAGDSWYWHKPMQGLATPSSLDERFYYGAHPLNDPLMSPIESNALLAKFPPTLLLTSSRAGEMSAAINTHRLLVRNGVDAALHMWDGLNHCFFDNPALPESKEAVAVIASFFDTRLGRRR